LARFVGLVLLGNVYICIFIFSEFSGLIYVSIWTHNLKFFLGHAAYARTLVLAIFKGGMALGAWLASHFSLLLLNPFFCLSNYRSSRRSLGLLFHNIFVTTKDFSYFTIIHPLSSAVVVERYKWMLAAFLILPQSVLLGK